MSAAAGGCRIAGEESAAYHLLELVHGHKEVSRGAQALFSLGTTKLVRGHRTGEPVDCGSRIMVQDKINGTLQRRVERPEPRKSSPNGRVMEGVVVRQKGPRGCLVAFAAGGATLHDGTVARIILRDVGLN